MGRYSGPVPAPIKGEHQGLHEPRHIDGPPKSPEWLSGI